MKLDPFPEHPSFIRHVNKFPYSLLPFDVKFEVC
jgi:hypothetical protein